MIFTLIFGVIFLILVYPLYKLLLQFLFFRKTILGKGTVELQIPYR